MDARTARVLKEKGSSLLPEGICAVSGNFESGALMRITAGGRLLSVGLSNYSLEEIERIRRLRSLKVAAILGDEHYLEVIHRDNLLLNPAI